MLKIKKKSRVDDQVAICNAYNLRHKSAKPPKQLMFFLINSFHTVINSQPLSPFLIFAFSILSL